MICFQSVEASLNYFLLIIISSASFVSSWSSKSSSSHIVQHGTEQSWLWIWPRHESAGGFDYSEVNDILLYFIYIVIYMCWIIRYFKLTGSVLNVIWYVPNICCTHVTIYLDIGQCNNMIVMLHPRLQSQRIKDSLKYLDWSWQLRMWGDIWNGLTRRCAAVRESRGASMRANPSWLAAPALLSYLASRHLASALSSSSISISISISISPYGASQPYWIGCPGFVIPSTMR